MTSLSVAWGDIHAGVTVETGTSVGCIVGVIVGWGKEVGVAVAGLPQEEINTATARHINNRLFMFTRLQKMNLMKASIARQN